MKQRYPYFEKAKTFMEIDDITTEELLEAGNLGEERIAEYDQKLKEADHYRTLFPIGYACELDGTAHYRIRFSEFFQLVKKIPQTASILDFVAGNTDNITAQLTGLVESLRELPRKKAREQGTGKDVSDPVILDMDEIITTAVTSTIGPLYQDNFFLFLIACAFLQYYIELSIFSFYPFAAIRAYEKLLGTTFDRSCKEYRDLEKDNPDELYDLCSFLEIGIKYTVDFVNQAKETLSHDLYTIVIDWEIMLDNTMLQKLYLLESNKQLKSQYINTNFNVHLMPLGTHKNDHKDIVNKIVMDNMDVREVYDIESVQDWFRFEFISLFKGNVYFKKCQCCERFFIPSGRSDMEYCERINEEYGKPCREIGATLAFAKKHENDEIHQAYTKAYRRMDSRKRTMYISKKKFTEWSKEAREKRKLCKDGQISLEEFQAWLDESKCR